MVPLKNPPSESAPPHYPAQIHEKKKVIHPLKIFSSLNPVNPGVKEQSSTGKIRDFKGKKLLLLEKNGLAEGSSQIFYEMPISPSATAAECPVCACIIHH